MNNGKKLLQWYYKNKRPLPWRDQKDPYRIWISEVMLQQTTVQTVIPYYNKFLKKFPTLKSLAQSSIEEVLPYWAGLGYYSRVRNLHQAAKTFMTQFKGKLPKKACVLKTLPGFGPYTSKAVSSIAYGEEVSVIDGNVIRVLCRHEGLSIPWWKEKEKLQLEKTARMWSLKLPPGDMNQAFMELGAVICTPKSPACSICPIQKTCKALKLKMIHQLPCKKPRKPKELWLWKPQVIIKDNKIFFTKTHSCPFLKGQWLLPGSVSRQKTIPKNYHFRHTITCHNIFIQWKISKKAPLKQGIWLNVKTINKTVPFSLIQKTLDQSIFVRKHMKKNRLFKKRKI